MERLLTAYQEDLLSLEQLRERMPLLRQREQTLRDELNALVEQARERAAHLRLAETLSAFLTRLRAAAETLDIVERQRIVRLIVVGLRTQDRRGNKWTQAPVLALLACPMNLTSRNAEQSPRRLGQSNLIRCRPQYGRVLVPVAIEAISHTSKRPRTGDLTKEPLKEDTGS